MYITCGRRGMTYLRETYCFDPGANSWTACAEGPVGRAWHGMAAVNGCIYVIGGSNADQCGDRRDVLKVFFTDVLFFFFMFLHLFFVFLMSPRSSLSYRFRLLTLFYILMKVTL